ncbi:hypothetical protein Vafri_15220 [Volvox africanus]|uniref:Uncharacterized protein n=1 Tax=Volvox africanus TaxID=51714 RepID=A0A8J4BG34_9CHLO|nr:hypothetical protein Vafri_15220 [Volvox africanus]
MDRPQHYQPTPTARKAVATLPQPITTKLLVAGHKRAACVRGPGREFLPIDQAKGTIEFARSEAKAGSSSDETPLDVWARSSYVSRNSVGRCGSGSKSPSPPRHASPELPKMEDVVKTTRFLLQPTHAIEHEFYADCYCACRVIPATTTAVPSNPAGRSADGGAAHLGTRPMPQRSPLSSVPEVALRLSCLGHQVVVRRVTDSRHYWSRSMTNMFCYCVLPGTGIGYVLDPNFKDHFKSNSMSDRYRNIWEGLPPLFVGPPTKLVQLVQALCTELQASFESDCRQLPPWRAFTCNINRWMSPVFRDVPVPMRRPMPAGSSIGIPGMIPAANARAFLLECEELLANTPSARPRAAVPAAAASSPVPWVAAATAGGTRGVAAHGTVVTPTATKSAARGPPPQAHRVVLGFELRQHVTVQPHVHKYAGGGEAVDTYKQSALPASTEAAGSVLTAALTSVCPSKR